MAFDTQRAVVATGEGIVARFPGVLCVARCPDAGPVRQLLALCAEAAGENPGRELARRFATWLTGPDAPGDRLAFGTLAAAGDQLAVFLVGRVDAWVEGPDGTALSGADAAIGTDRLLPRPAVPVALCVGELGTPADTAELHDLRSGVVPGVGVLLYPPSARAVDDSAGAVAAPADPPAAPPPPAPVESPEPPPDHDWFAARPEPPPVTAAPAVEPWDAPAWPSRSNGSAARVNGASTTVAVPTPTAAPWASGRHAILDPAPGDPLPTGPVGQVDGTAEAGEATVAAEPGDRTRVPSPVPRPSPAPQNGGPVEASGYLCEQGHLSDPRAPFCGQCGAAVDDRAGGLVTGARPALGRLVFDDGASYPVEDGLLVGRLPESDDRVRAGGLRPVVVEDPTGSVSRVHAEIQVSGWDVLLLDAGSRNGTFVAGPEDTGWSPLPHPGARRLLPGTRVRLGGRTFIYESSSGLR